MAENFGLVSKIMRPKLGRKSYFTPEITEIDIDDECNYIVMCCDGIFDVMSEDNIMQCVNEAKRRKSNESSNIICAEAANIILKCAMKRVRGGEL